MPNPNEPMQKDDPRQAMESGEPLEQGRERGRVVDEKTRGPEDSSAQRGKAGDNQDWESGRQQAQ